MDIFTKIVRPTRNPMPSNAVSSPIFQTSAYAFEDIDEVDQILRGERPGYSYTRGGNPNSHALEQFISGIEETEDAVVTASGTASLSTGILGLCPKPCHIFCLVKSTGVRWASVEGFWSLWDTPWSGWTPTMVPVFAMRYR